MRHDDERARVIRRVTLLPLCLAACGPAEYVLERVSVPAGATFTQVADSLHARGVVRSAVLLRWYATLRDTDRAVKPGVYDLPKGAPWREILDELVAGRSVGYVLTIPEGARAAQLAASIGPIVGLAPESVTTRLLHPSLADSLGAPGPSMEGYLFPATYRFTRVMRIEELTSAILARYREVWTPGRRARLDSLGLSERELITLASVIRAETARPDDLPLVSAVFHNRLREGMPLQADASVRYALPLDADGVRRADIDAFSDHPYNTYFIEGLPPGPINGPDVAAIEAALFPADVSYRYFVASRDGRSLFARTFEEHRANISRVLR